ncbi:hypothetical protein BJ742DRAFT_899053 [Cladochytrium replicatum]|nr:hypothetical protein BJ742DRAFT_899053 [Cladochytrium replicatum]
MGCAVSRPDAVITMSPETNGLVNRLSVWEERPTLSGRSRVSTRNMESEADPLALPDPAMVQPLGTGHTNDQAAVSAHDGLKCKRYSAEMVFRERWPENPNESPAPSTTRFPPIPTRPTYVLSEAFTEAPRTSPTRRRTSSTTNRTNGTPSSTRRARKRSINRSRRTSHESHGSAVLAPYSIEYPHSLEIVGCGIKVSYTGGFHTDEVTEDEDQDLWSDSDVDEEIVKARARSRRSPTPIAEESIEEDDESIGNGRLVHPELVPRDSDATAVSLVDEKSGQSEKGLFGHFQSPKPAPKRTITPERKGNSPILSMDELDNISVPGKKHFVRSDTSDHVILETVRESVRYTPRGRPPTEKPPASPTRNSTAGAAKTPRVRTQGSFANFIEEKLKRRRSGMSLQPSLETIHLEEI